MRPREIFWSGPARPGLPGSLRLVSDAVKNAGPLAGLSACLNLLESDLLVAMAVDLPRIDASFLQKLLAQCSPAIGVVCQRGDFFEPLAAIYPRGFRVLAAEHLAQRHHRLQDLVREAVQQGLLRIVSLGEEDMVLFKNMNSPDDLNGGF